MDQNYCVYEHVFPNGKRYIGLSSNVFARWKNGAGYEKQPKMQRAIKKYGWDNIVHNVILEGLSREQAIKLEMYLIDSLKTIENGYNVSIGGEKINGYYYTTYLRDMVAAARRYNIDHKIIWRDNQTTKIVDFVYGDRYDKMACGLWNEAADAVTRKHREYSSTNQCDVSEFFYYLMQYYILWLKYELKEDVSEWKEMSFEIARCFANIK